MIVAPRSTLIVFALENEAQGHFHDLNTVFCGVGKVNAAYHLMHHLAAWQRAHGHAPELVINAGSAGSSTFAAGTLVNCTRFVQRDMDATALSCAPYATPFDGTPTILANGLRLEPHLEGTCGTADNFATNGTNGPWNVADMEGFALAKVCHHEDIPFCCLKYITDGADADSASTWEAALDHTALVLRKAIADLFGQPDLATSH